MVRTRAHNVFESTHRFGGRTAIALFWALTLHLGAGASSWQAWVLALVTASVVTPWLRRRRVPVTVERPSSHAALVSFDYGVAPAIASAVGISRSPLREWHAFATVRSPGRPGYGDALVDEVVASQPDAVIWDTTVRGKPDLLRLAVDACRDFRAEAAFVVSNQLTTFRVVRGLERAGIPAFGPIWDS